MNPQKNAPLNQHVGACPVIPESVACKLRHRLCQLLTVISSCFAQACNEMQPHIPTSYHRSNASAFLSRGAFASLSVSPALEHICCAEGPWFQWDSNGGPSASKRRLAPACRVISRAERTRQSSAAVKVAAVCRDIFQGPARSTGAVCMVGILGAARRPETEVELVPTSLTYAKHVPTNSSRCSDIPMEPPRRSSKFPTCAVQQDNDSSELSPLIKYLRGREILMMVGLPLLMPVVSRFRKKCPPSASTR